MKEYVSPEALTLYGSKLSLWQAPSDFVELVKQLSDEVPSEQYFSDPKAAFARDTKVGARLASITSASNVRLGAEWARL
jgi:hypothetical protein